jgi:hypothetical protein
MRFQDAIAKSIEAYYAGKLPTNPDGEEFPYTLDYFKELEEMKADDIDVDEKEAADEDDA